MNIFLKSVKGLPETEKAWVLLENVWKDVKYKKGNLLYRCKSCVDKFPYNVVHNGPCNFYCMAAAHCCKLIQAYYSDDGKSI